MRVSWHHLPLWLGSLAASAAAGVAYSLLFSRGFPFHSAVYGTFIGLPVIAFEAGVVLTRLRLFIQRLPTVLALFASETVYLVLITLGHATAGILLTATTSMPMTLLEAATPSGQVLLYSLAVSAVVVSVMRVRELIGSEVFLSFLIGRYHRPIEEERVFLFLDLAGSTRFAEEHGDLRTQEFLGAFFAALAEPVRDHRGSIDDYVGDMALITWPVERGVENAACLRCVFAAEAAIRRDAAQWRARFGLVPQFRAALHAGPVVTAEIGVDRHKIAYFGDTVNTTARLETLAKTLDTDVLASRDLLDRIGELPKEFLARPLGEHALRGREHTVAVAAIERASAVAPRPAWEEAS